MTRMHTGKLCRHVFLLYYSDFLMAKKRLFVLIPKPTSGIILYLLSTELSFVTLHYKKLLPEYYANNYTLSLTTIYFLYTKYEGICMDYLARGVLIIGIFLLIGALLPVGILIGRVCQGETRIKWAILGCFILFAIVGYFVYTFQGVHLSGLLDLIIPLVFFLGASFVWLVTMVSLQTANDVRRIAHLEEENVTDPLMGIYNRRFFDKRIKEEITRAQRFDLQLSVFMIDIDHFKSVNDFYGHKTGDIVLRNLGKLILGASRNSDIIARYGGEEICLIAPNTPDHEAKIIAERLCQLVDSSTLITPEDTRRPDVPHITVSIGVATLNGLHGDSRNILAIADEAMYQAKSLGRNCVAVAQEPLSDADTTAKNVSPVI
jgi:diguanylate cyclase (GGDEF)-like protein